MQHQPISARSRHFNRRLVEVSTNDLFHVLRDVLSFLSEKNPDAHGTIVSWAKSVLGVVEPGDKTSIDLPNLMKCRARFRDIVQDSAMNHPQSGTAKAFRCKQYHNKRNGTTYGHSIWFNEDWTDKRPAEENTLTIGEANAVHLICEIDHRISKLEEHFYPTCDYDCATRHELVEIQLYFNALCEEAEKHVADYATHREKNIQFREQNSQKHYERSNQNRGDFRKAPGAPSKPRGPKTAPAGNLAPKKLDFSKDEPVEDSAEDPKSVVKPVPVVLIPIPETRAVTKNFSFATILKKKSAETTENKGLVPPPCTPEVKSPETKSPRHSLSAESIVNEPADDSIVSEATEEIERDTTPSKKVLKRRAQKARKAAEKVAETMKEITAEPAMEAIELTPTPKLVEKEEMVLHKRMIVGDDLTVSYDTVLVSSKDLAKLKSGPNSPSK